MRFVRPVAGVAVAAVLLAIGATTSRPVLEVGPGAPVQDLISAVPEGWTIRLAPGSYGPLVVDRPVDVAGTEGAVIAAGDAEAGVVVTADGASVSGLAISGGASGLMVREAQRVAISDIKVRGARTHGIEIVDASVELRDADIAGLVSPYAQGIEIRNSDGRPDSSIRGSVVRGGQEGIVSHVSEVVIEDNDVRATTMRAIAVTEMSDGWIFDNTIAGAEGAGIYCGDMSRCESAGNRVSLVEAGEGGRSSQGWGLVVNYHASASSTGDELAGVAGETLTLIGSRITQRSPLEPGAGSRAVWPALAAVAIALGGLAVIYLLVRRGLRAPLGSTLASTTTRGRAAGQAFTAIMATGLAIQTFHMSEHALQLYRVKFDGVPSRGGIVGPVVEAEWIHFFYNGAVWAAMALLLVARRRGWKPRGNLLAGDRLLVAATVLQGYHFIEHSLKLSQHLATGSKVNPGALGHQVDLVLLHFSINLAVYAGFSGACLCYAWARRRTSVVSRTAPAT